MPETTIPVQMAIAIEELRNTVALHAGKSLEERIIAAMRAARLDGPFFLYSDVISDGQRFQSAIGAVLLETTGDEHELVARSLRFVLEGSTLLNALVDGVPVDIEEMTRRLERDWPDRELLLPLRIYWSRSQ